MPIRPVVFKSPSTTSTASLAQLHDKLAILPPYKHAKESVPLGVRPGLSVVLEITESVDDFKSNSSTSTLKLRTCGETSKKFKVHRKSQSDSEVAKNKDSKVYNLIQNRKTQNCGETINYYPGQIVSEIDENSSCLMQACADHSVINDTLEGIFKNKDNSSNSIVELPVQEIAPENIPDDNRLLDSGISTGYNKKTQEFQTCTQIIENSESLDKVIRVKPNYKPQKESKKLVSKSTSDESNTEAINDTPISYVNVRKRNLQSKKSFVQKPDQRTQNTVPQVDDNLRFNVRDVEDFFSQHFAQNKDGDLIMSPTLAKKINESSSEGHDDFDRCLMSNMDFNTNIDLYETPDIDMDIVECLNTMVDKVCDDFNRCTEYLNTDNEVEILNVAETVNNKSKEPQLNYTSDQTKDTKLIKKGTTSSKRKPIKLTYNKVEKKKAPRQQKKLKNKLEIEPTTKMSTIIEANNEVGDQSLRNTSQGNPKKQSHDETNDLDITLARRKRKLYSPKDHVDNSRDEVIKITIDEDDVALSEIKKTNVLPETKASCYIEIERERNEHRLRSRKSRGITSSPISSKVKKNNIIFDNLKDNIESNVKITIADKAAENEFAIFNFTTDSEDEEFKIKKSDLQKRISTTTIDSGNSIISKRLKSRSEVNQTKNENSNIQTKNKTPITKRKRTTKRQNSKAKSKPVILVPEIDMRDEKMRGAVPEELNTSLVAENPIKRVMNEDLDPAILIPIVELIIDEDIKKKATKTIKEKKGVKKAGKPTKKDKHDEMEFRPAKNADDDSTISPLPGLVVETAPTEKEADDSLTTNMIQKIKNVYRDGPDNLNETNTTHNLLSDYEKTLNSVQINFNEERNEIEDNSRLENTSIHDRDSRCDIRIVAKSKSNTQISDKNKEESKDDRNISNSTSTHRRRNLKLKIKKEICRTTQEHDLESVNILNNSPKTKIILPSNLESKCDNSETARPVISKRKAREVVTDIIDITENVLEKSIATASMTGHGDLIEVENEDPPSTDDIIRSEISREVVDMDESMKEYYMELKNAINEPNYCTITNIRNDNISIESREAQGSPVIAIKRISSHEISKWMSQYDNVSTKPRNFPENDISRWLPSQRTSDSDESAEEGRSSKRRRIVKSRSPTVSPNNNVSNKSGGAATFIISNVLPPASKMNTSKCKINKERVLYAPESENLTEDNAENTSEFSNDAQNIAAKSKSRNSTKERVLNTTTSEHATQETAANTSKTLNEITQRATIISPITVFDDLILKSTFNDISEEIVDQSKNTSSQTLKTAADGRKSATSEPSVTSVEDWLKSNEPTTSGVNVDVSDAFKNVLERINTTLSEIHQNTTANFIKMFLDAQVQLNEMKADRREMYKKTANKLKSLADELQDMDNRSEEKETQFISWLKKRAVQNINEEVTKKRAMVCILREDVQAVMDHVKRRKL